MNKWTTSTVLGIVLSCSVGTAALAADNGLEDGSRIPAQIVPSVVEADAVSTEGGTLLYGSDLISVHRLPNGSLLLDLSIREEEPLVGTWHIQLDSYSFKSAGGPQTTVLLNDPPVRMEKLAVRYVPFGLSKPPVVIEPVRLAQNGMDEPNLAVPNHAAGDAIADNQADSADGDSTAAKETENVPSGTASAAVPHNDSFGGTAPHSAASQPADQISRHAADSKPAPAPYSMLDPAAQPETGKGNSRLPALLLGLLLGTGGVASFFFTKLVKP